MKVPELVICMKFKLNCFKTTNKYCIGGAFKIPAEEKERNRGTREVCRHKIAMSPVKQPIYKNSHANDVTLLMFACRHSCNYYLG